MASKFADYALGHSTTGDGIPDPALSSAEPDKAEDAGIQAKRIPSVLDVLMWKESACEQATLRKKPRTCARRTSKQDPAGNKQLFLDFGQKNFSSTTCNVCNMVYCPGLPEEEAIHRREHKRVTEGVEFRCCRDACHDLARVCFVSSTETLGAPSQIAICLTDDLLVVAEDGRASACAALFPMVAA